MILNMKTKKVEKVITTLKDRIGHPFEEATYRNLDMSQQAQSSKCKGKLEFLALNRPSYLLAIGPFPFFPDLGPNLLLSSLTLLSFSF